MNQTRYESLTGLRAYSAVGIVCLHVFTNGGSYGITGFVGEQLIPSFTNLVFLFMIISGFSMCCGYYDKVMSGSIDFKQFYGKRFAKVWPFFAILCALEMAITPNGQSLRETFLNLTLSFTLLTQRSFSVIGVGWFLGVVFVFYYIFPFYCYLISSQRRAWLAFTAALLMNCIGSVYYDVTRSNFGYSAVFFLAGGLIYIYRHRLEEIATKFKWAIILISLITVIMYFVYGPAVPIMLFMYSLILIYSLGVSNSGLLINCATKFISDVSLEIYLCHMVVFRLLEKMKLVHVFGNNIASYIVTCATVIIGAIVLSYLVNWLIGNISRIINKVLPSAEKIYD